MKKSFFKILSKVVNSTLPRYSKSDLTRLSKFGKAVVALRYWATINALD